MNTPFLGISPVVVSLCAMLVYQEDYKHSVSWHLTCCSVSVCHVGVSR